MAGLTSLPLLAVAGPGTAPCTAAVADDGSPSILGPAALTAGQLRSWWEESGRAQPTRLAIDIGEVIGLYLSEGSIEGVRGDLAFAQAILETSYFTNSDTARNNFAGIAHYDDAAAGRPFDSPAIGVRAHIQLLHRFAAGNDVTLSRLDVAPNAGARAETWAQLAGTWATDTRYWTSLQSLYVTMSGTGALDSDAPAPTGSCAPGATVAGGYALPVPRHWYDEHPTWFTKPHHDYPAADIPVPTGTPIYAAAPGTVAWSTTSGSCGVGLAVEGDDGAQYTYCHGLPGSTTVVAGAKVNSGQLLMRSASTGNSTGPHLHFAIKANGQLRCPQNFFVAIAIGRPSLPHGLPIWDCTT
jgi:murein DD-endopeptidase MepM/ murein hydrolase activator NlpD